MSFVSRQHIFLDNIFRRANSGFLLIAKKDGAQGCLFGIALKIRIIRIFFVKMLTPDHLRSDHDGSANVFLEYLDWELGPLT